MNKQHLYTPLYSPWLADDFDEAFQRAEARTLVSRDRCYVLQQLLLQSLYVHGVVIECGVYRGGTAAMLAYILRRACSAKRLHLFDTFSGMPETDPAKDLHRAGDFSDTTLEMAQRTVRDHQDLTVWHVGFIPDTFKGLDDDIMGIAFAHIDVDIYKSIIDSLNWIWPRLSVGGVLVFDDYGFRTCPGARDAVDEFFRTRKAVPLALQTGQAIVFKAVYGNA